jgi:hypothetical protein
MYALSPSCPAPVLHGREHPDWIATSTLQASAKLEPNRCTGRNSRTTSLDPSHVAVAGAGARDQTSHGIKPRERFRLSFSRNRHFCSDLPNQVVWMIGQDIYPEGRACTTCSAMRLDMGCMCEHDMSRPSAQRCNMAPWMGVVSWVSWVSRVSSDTRRLTPAMSKGAQSTE